MTEQRPDTLGGGNDEQGFWAQDRMSGRVGEPGDTTSDAEEAHVVVGEETVELPSAGGMERTIHDIPTIPPSRAHPSEATASTPSSTAPDYSAPGYSAPGYSAPGYSAPGYSAPGYSAPGYTAPGYTAPAPAYPSYQASSAQPPGQDYRTTSTWTPSAPASPQPAASARATDKRRRGFGAATLVGVAAMAATLGGGTGYALNRFLEPNSAAVSTSSTKASPAPAATVTQVVQGNSSAPDWKVTAEAIKGSVVSIVVSDGQSGGQGSGVVLDTSGHIVTNNHVVSDVAGGADVTVIIGDNTYDATLVGTDPSTDLAVLQLVNPPSDLKPMAIADSSLVAVGDPVMAFGNPLGLADTATTGIVSAINRPVTTTASGAQNQSSGDDTVVTSAIQTSAMINPGNSGGALVNANGELIGITSSGATLTNSDLGQSGSIGLGFAIPSNLVTSITEQLIETGKARHAYVGISTNDATADLGDETFMGASIVSVVSGTPADTAGLARGDVITALDGISVASSESLVGLIRSLQPGQVVELTIIRGGTEITKKVTLGSR